MVHPNNGILFSNKKEWNTDTYYNMNEPWKRAKWEKSDTKGHILYDSTWNVHKRQKEYTKSRCAWGMGSDYQGEFLFQVMKFTEGDCGDGGAMNMLKVNKLYILREWILWPMNLISIIKKFIPNLFLFYGSKLNILE